MRAGIRIETEGFADLAALWELAPDIVREEMTGTTWEAELLLEREIKELTPVGVGGAGGLRGSIGAREPAVLADNVLGLVGTSAAHALPVELGTKPHFPPLEPLRDWVRQKLDVRDERVDGVALAIARKIAARGTLAVGMFHRGFAAQQAQIQARYEAMNVRIRDRLSEAH